MTYTSPRAFGAAFWFVTACWAAFGGFCGFSLGLFAALELYLVSPFEGGIFPWFWVLMLLGVLIGAAAGIGLWFAVLVVLGYIEAGGLPSEHRRHKAT